MTFELFVFDIAGTTLNDTGGIVAQCFEQALEENDQHFSQDQINTVMGYRKIDAIRMLLSEDAAPLSASEEKQAQDIHDLFLQKINTYYLEKDIREIDGISELFSELANRGIKIALNTGFSRSTTDIIVQKLGWQDQGLINTSITSDEVAEGRPYPDMINTLVSRLGISSNSAVAKVGDTPSDLLEGKNADCGLTIGVLYGTHTKDQLVKYDHDYLISAPSEILAILDSEPSLVN
jgi:phosphonatase-like hydrolase